MAEVNWHSYHSICTLTQLEVWMAPNPFSITSVYRLWCRWNVSEANPFWCTNAVGFADFNLTDIVRHALKFLMHEHLDFTDTETVKNALQFWMDNYSWIHQLYITEILRNALKSCSHAQSTQDLQTSADFNTLVWNAITPRLPQPVKFLGWKVHAYMPANTIFGGPVSSCNKSTFNAVHFDRNPFTSSCEAGKKSRNDLKFGTFMGCFPSEVQQALQWKGLNTPL